jgi:hypothetical protein
MDLLLYIDSDTFGMRQNLRSASLLVASNRCGHRYCGSVQYQIFPRLHFVHLKSTHTSREDD